MIVDDHHPDGSRIENLWAWVLGPASLPGSLPGMSLRSKHVVSRRGQEGPRNRRGGIHPVQLHPPPPGEDAVRGGLPRRAHLCRESSTTSAAAMSHERLSFVHGRHPGRRPRPRSRRRRGRDRQRRGRVARREVDRGRRARVRDDERRGDADPARRDPRGAGRALHPVLFERGLRNGGERAHGRGASAQPAQPLRGDEGGRRPPRLLVLRDLRTARS